MSRIGRQAIRLPDGVTVVIEPHVVTATGSKGTLTLAIDPRVTVTQAEGQLRVERATTDKKAGAFQGLFVRLLSNLVTGVATGFAKRLEINGVGYKAALAGSRLTLNVGFSHPVILEAPQGVDLALVKNSITVSGVDKQAVGQFSAIVRGVRPPEPYKGKGIRYSDEHVRRKAGKAAKAAGSA